MNNQRYKRENLNNIKGGFLERIRSDADYKATVQYTRIIHKSAIIAIAAIVIVISTAIYAVASGFLAMPAWQGLFDKKTAVKVNEQSTSAGISMEVKSLYTDGSRAILAMTLRDIDGERLNENIRIYSFDNSNYFAHVVDSYYDAETGEVTCIILVTFSEDVSVGDSFVFAVDSIFVNLDYSDAYHPLDFDLYEAALNSNLQPSLNDSEWTAFARENPINAYYTPEYESPRIGMSLNSVATEVASHRWLPLDASFEGEDLTHWLSVLGVGYEDGMFHVQMRYNGLFGSTWRGAYGDPVLIDNDGKTISTYAKEYEGDAIYDVIICCGYQEQRFYIGSIENLKNLKLAWTGTFAEYVIEGDWRVDIDLAAIGSSISESVEIKEHPDVTNVSFKLSPMYLETVRNTTIDCPDFSSMGILDPRELPYDLIIWRDKMNNIESNRELAIILTDGTRINLYVGKVFDPENNLRGIGESPDNSTGKTQITTWHILDGSFDIEDVAEVIVFGVSFRLA
jgi:hypothetical protein